VPSSAQLLLCSKDQWSEWLSHVQRYTCGGFYKFNSNVSFTYYLMERRGRNEGRNERNGRMWGAPGKRQGYADGREMGTNTRQNSGTISGQYGDLGFAMVFIPFNCPLHYGRLNYISNVFEPLPMKLHQQTER